MPLENVQNPHGYDIFGTSRTIVKKGTELKVNFTLSSVKPFTKSNLNPMVMAFFKTCKKDGTHKKINQQPKAESGNFAPRTL